ncbi:site-specific integrase [Pedobacter cryotolerans]|uniref:Site-specific integrase n=1 Tax=Pedobacter cryotolerans TaxID=2571270 RepID=A0A4U1C796_9SPHI|nr:site-specific integrase [Pedobacter cryotolerans]TKC01395.1 site-specific integrase [Pedobacter cryotolerans]
MSIKIVQKKLQNNKVSLALKIYQEGKSKQYKLKDLFLYSKPTNLNEKNHNAETKKLAESILAKRQLEIQSTSYNVHTGFKSQGSFLEYFNKLGRERRESEGNYGNWKSAYKHLLNFANGNDVKFSDCDDDFLKGFKRFLLEAKLTKSNTRLSNNSALSYLNKVKAALTQAYNDRIITDNPGSRIKGIQQEENPREYLLHEELKKLVKTPCDVPMLKTAFLFSCITGLRWSDINKLDWKEVIYSEAENQWKIHFKQKKTKGIQYHPISDEAYEMLVNDQNQLGRVFKGLKYSAWNNHKLAEWVWKDADIKKKITFHCARHTYATLLLTSGGDIYTVSSLLGHQNLKTTQIYAKIINPKKNETVDLIPRIYG